MARRLSIFAGAGSLVPHVIEAAKAAGDKVQVLSLTPRTDLNGVKVINIDVGNPLGIIWSLKVFRTTHITMAGGIHLPDRAREGLLKFASSNGSDRATKIGPIGDAALADVGGLFKKMTGADLIGVHEISPDLLAGEGLIAGPQTGVAIDFALQTARAIGQLDIGQAAVVCGERIIAVEDIGGTDALIDRIAQLRQQGLTGDAETPSVLAKALKPQQALFADLPSIGPDTVANCAKAGIAVIAVEAGRSLVLELEKLRALAEQHRVSVIGIRVAHD